MSPRTEAVAALRQGGLVVYPTDTLWGLGARIDSIDAVKRVYEAKERPLDQPLSIAVASTEAIETYAMVTPLARRLFPMLPGPLTLVMARRASVPDIVTCGDATVAVRVPAHPAALALASAVGAITATSANRHGRADPRSLADAREQLGDRADYYLDDSSPPSGAASTIVDVRSDVPLVVRPGALSERKIRQHLGH